MYQVSGFMLQSELDYRREQMPTYRSRTRRSLTRPVTQGRHTRRSFGRQQPVRA